jgi:hypothetical protein
VCVGCHRLRPVGRSTVTGGRRSCSEVIGSLRAGLAGGVLGGHEAEERAWHHRVAARPMTVDRWGSQAYAAEPASSAARALNRCAACAAADDATVAATTSPATWIARRGAMAPTTAPIASVPAAVVVANAHPRGDVGVEPFVERTGVI